MKDRVIINIRKIFEHEEDYYKPIREGKFRSKVLLKMKVAVIDIKHYHLKNILIKLDHTYIYDQDIINIFKRSDMWKIQLTMSISFLFIFFKDMMKSA